MRKLAVLAVTATLLVLSACVTINVYFPAAQVEQAAREFVDKVIGDELPGERPPVRDESSSIDAGNGARSFSLLSLFISEAHAQQQPDITIRTPAIQAIQSRMAQRFDSTLRAHFDSGALGFGGDGLVVVRDASQVPLKDRAAVNQAVAEDNRDRNAVYREIAVANNHPEWEDRIRETFARQWIERAKGGWWYQEGGSWKQK